jgi:outer membrane protein TolC
MSSPSRFACAVLICATRLAADDAPAAGTRLTLAEAVDRARAHSARLAQFAALETAAKAGVREARAGRLPQVDVAAGYARLSNVPELSLVLPGTPPLLETVFPNIPNTYRAHAGLTQSLYTGGRVDASVEAADHQLGAAGRDVQAAVQDLVLETTTAYWSLTTARETARVLTESLASFEAHLKDAQNRLDVGMAAKSEVLAVQVERDRAELGRLQAENASAIANEDLLRLVGLPPDTRIEPADETAVAPTTAADPDALVAAAVAARPELAALRSRARAADAAVTVARAPALPQVGLSAGYDYARPNTRILPLVDEWKDSWSLGLNVSITAFDGGRTKAAAAQASALAEALRHQLEDFERRVRVEVKSRLLDVATAQAALAVANRALESAQEAERVERDRYHEGVSASSDLLDAETRRLRAGVDRTNATASLSVARARLDRAVGR